MSSEILKDVSKNGRLVKLFWKDSTGEDRVKKGHVLKVGSDFIKFRTDFNSYFVSRAAITSLKVMEGGE